MHDCFEEEEVKSLMHDYFEVMYTQNLQIFDKVFHPSCVLYNAQDGKIDLTSVAQYRESVKNRKSPKELNSPRDETILAVEVFSNEMANIKTRYRMYDNMMYVNLTLLKSDEGWQIAAKMWTRVGPA
jgi:hypothetical protein